MTCGAFHYLAAARAAATVPLPWREVALVQLTASAANRITPAGLGGGAEEFARLVTFWTPAVIGLFVSRRPNRNGAL